MWRGGRWFGVVLCSIWLISCGPEPISPDAPADWPPLIIPEKNPLTEEGVALGRRLFYDPILSKDSTVSCATCHEQHLAFTDGRARSVGVEGREGRRSAMSLANVGFQYRGLFWDGRVATLEEQSLHPVTDSNEMNNDWDEVARRLRRHPVYPKLFRAAFGDQPIDSIRVGWALAQFERTLISADSRYDKMTRGEIDFTLAEQRGWTIFFDASMKVPHAECNHCHVDPFFANPQFQNNGLAKTTSESGLYDKGRGEVTGNRYDEGKFRVPTLRNIALTAPYMHDGRFATLEEVLDHYNQGGHPGLNVSPNVRPLHLSEQDKQDVLAFLHTLTDSSFLNREAYRNPFIYD